MNQEHNHAIIRIVPAANALNRVEGFDPLKLVRRIRSERTEGEAYRLDLPYQKLWFRLACPAGRMELNRLRITDQLAIFEAAVFSEKGDDKPLAKVTASATPGDSPNGKYIQAAQDMALSEALESAGFGIQLCDIAQGAGRSNYGSVAQTTQPQEDGELPFTMKSEEPAPGPQPAAMPAQKAEAAPPADAAQKPAGTQGVKPKTAANSQSTGKEEKAPTRLPSSLELLQASTHAQVIEFPKQQSAPNQGSADEQPAPNEDGGEPPMNTAAPAAGYTADMTVEEITARMTLDEARAVVVNEGICKGWTLGQVSESRPASLRFYVHSNRSDNVLKAAAQLVMLNSTGQKAG